jgi:hypothetical protein
VESDAALTQSVMFEFEDAVAADAFAQAIGADAPSSRLRSVNGWMVAVRLFSQESHLALVLRRAEAWLTATGGRGGILFHLDGRSYLLRAESSEPGLSASVAGASWDD